MVSHFSTLVSRRCVLDTPTDQDTPTRRSVNDEFASRLQDHTKAPLLLPAKDYDLPNGVKVKDEWKCRNTALVGGVSENGAGLTKCTSQNATAHPVTIIDIGADGRMNVRDKSSKPPTSDKRHSQSPVGVTRPRLSSLNRTSSAEQNHAPSPVTIRRRSSSLRNHAHTPTPPTTPAFQLPEPDYHHEDDSEAETIEAPPTGIRHLVDVKYAGTGDDVPVDYTEHQLRQVDNYQPRLPRFHFTS